MGQDIVKKLSSSGLLTVLLVLGLAPLAWGEPTAYIIHRTGGKVVLEPFNLPPAADERREGLVVWSSDGQDEHWQWWEPGAAWPPRKDGPEESLLASGTRSAAGAPGGLGSLQGTLRLAQLSTGVARRGKLGQFFTPSPGGVALHPTPTFRRATDDGQLPEAEVAVLDAGNRKVLQFTMQQGVSETAWRNLPNLPASLKSGLPPGEYRIRLGDEKEVTSFRVAEESERSRVLGDAEQLRSIVDPRHSGIAALFEIQLLLAQRTPKGQPAYLADVIDLIDQTPAPQSRFLESLRKELMALAMRLAVNPDAIAQTAAAARDSDTGVGPIDQVRRLIEEGAFLNAETTLARFNPEGQREAGLKKLYQAVIDSEAGTGRLQAASNGFEEAANLLASASSAEQLRVAVNESGFRLRLVQDQLNNHSFRIATGGERPFLKALESWIEANETTVRALKLSRESRSKYDEVACLLNIARAQLLLSEALSVMSVSCGNAEKCLQLADEAMRGADRDIEAVQADPATGDWKGLLLEMRANLAYRSRRLEDCRQRIDESLAAYVDEGSLPGVESVLRLAGLVAIDAGDRGAALRHFEASQTISELLRSQFPSDQLGVGRAGFFARRGYVYEQIIDLLVEAGESERALYYVELAKARSAQDLLATRGISSGAADAAVPAEDLLDHWPRDVAAIEYFIGDRRAFGFLIAPDGAVTSWTLQGDQGQPLESQTLIREIKAFLSGIESQSVKMRRSILSGKGLDHTWQDDLHRFYQQLIPESVRPTLNKAGRVVIVPHHILHYFPFAALVTERDPRTRGKLEMASPKFLVDAPFAIEYAPSLGVWDLLGRTP